MKQFILFTLTFIYLPSFSQISINGKVMDSSQNALPYSTVVISKSTDSTMVSYAITNTNGDFKLEKINPGNYFIQISFMGYSNFRKNLTVNSNDTEINLGKIILKDDSKQLNDLVIEGEQMPILFKKDTVEYNAGSFKTKKNENVEGLLKQLPGVEVDENGDVTAQGEKVTKIFVDGKEFFGDDPKIATKNIPADAIKKVQVFDKKSDLSEFTGIDDGERTRTINLTLKEDRKKGYFGDIMAGGGYQDKYEGKLNLNRFSKTAQFTSLLMANNINQQGFSYQDYFNFMGGISNVMKTGKMNFDPSSTGVPINTPGSNNGIANTLAGGINYNQDFTPKTHFISSFFVNNSNTNINRYTNTTTYTDNGNFVSTSYDNQNQALQNYRLNTELKQVFNEDNLLDIKAIGIFSNNNNNGISREENTFSGNNNSSSNISKDFGNGLNGTIDANYRLKLKKEGRSINTQGKYYLLNSNNNRLTDIERILSYNSTTTNNYQKQNNNNSNQQFSGAITFTEPLNRKTFLIVDYQSFYQTEKTNKDFFDLANDTETKNNLLSNTFTSDYLYNQLGTKINYKVKKNLFVTGLDAQLSNLKGSTSSNLISINKDFSVLLPNFYWKKQAGMSNRMELTYQTSFNEPSVNQLQPVINNTNPLNIYTGNPNLNPEYLHNLNYTYFKYDAFNYSNTSFNLGLNATQNKIVNAQFIDTLTNLRSSSPINVNENYGAQTNVGYGFRIKKIKTQIRANMNASFNKGINFINNIKNDAYTYNYGGRLTIGNQNKKIIDASAGVKINVNQNNFSLNKEANATYINSSIFAEINIDLKNNWSFGADANQNFYTGSLYNNNLTFLIVNAYVSKTILKNQRGDLKLYVSDLLNQRNGLNYYGQQNYFTESQVNVLRRYIMLNFTYKIIKI